MITLIECSICRAHHSQMREHCPFCGARTVFLASHSYKPQHTQPTMRAQANSSNAPYTRELVRAYVQRHVAHTERRLNITTCDCDN